MRLFVILLLIISPFSQVFAQTISVVQPLSWGEAVLTDNTAQREIVIATDGNFTNDPEFLIIENPDVGVYQLTGDLPNRPIASVTVTVDRQMQGGGQEFTLDSFTTSHPATTDGSGNATINVGGRMLSSGSGTPYNTSQPFTADLTLSVNY
jgi:hypothetical protein